MARRRSGTKCFVENIRLLSSQSPFCDSYNLVDILQYGVPPFIIMRRGEVGLTHKILILAYAGSSPAAVAKKWADSDCNTIRGITLSPSAYL